MSNTAGVAKPPPPAVGDDPGVADLVKQKLDERIKKNPKAGMVMGVSLGTRTKFVNDSTLTNEEIRQKLRSIQVYTVSVDAKVFVYFTKEMAERKAKEGRTNPETVSLGDRLLEFVKDKRKYIMVPPDDRDYPNGVRVYMICLGRTGASALQECLYVCFDVEQRDNLLKELDKKEKEDNWRYSSPNSDLASLVYNLQSESSLISYKFAKFLPLTGETATKPKSAPIAPMSLALNTPKTIDKSSGEMSRMSEDLSVDGTEPNITNSTSGSKRSGDVIIETPSVDTEAAKNKLLLDEKKASNKRCLLKLYVNCECQRQMHRLAEMYYGSRDNWYHFIPLTILTLISGIFAFGSTSDFFEGKTKEVFSLIVGICSILSGAVQSCSKNHNYAEKSKAHKTVALGMKKLGDEVTFDRIDPKSGLSAKGNTKKNKAADEEQGLGSNDEREAATMAEKVQGYRMVFNQVMESCDSIIPSHIAEGFALIDARMAIMLNSEQTHDRVENTLLLEEANARSIILANTYAELYTVYSTKTCWPWHYPNPDLAVSKAIRNVERTYGKSLHLFGNSFTTNEESPLLDCCTP